MKCVPWSDEDVARARAMYREGKRMAEIGAALGRSPGAVSHKLHAPSSPVGRHELGLVTWGDSKRDIPASVLIERERRVNAPRTLAGIILGDPPIGFSALDRRGGNSA